MHQFLNIFSKLWKINHGYFWNIKKRFPTTIWESAFPKYSFHADSNPLYTRQQTGIPGDNAHHRGKNNEHNGMDFFPVGYQHQRQQGRC